MHSDDFLAQQVMKANNPARVRADCPAVVSLSGMLWRGIRHLAAGLDAFSSVWHGIEVPPDHESRHKAAPSRRTPGSAGGGGTPSAPGSGPPATPSGQRAN